MSSKKKMLKVRFFVVGQENPVVEVNADTIYYSAKGGNGPKVVEVNSDFYVLECSTLDKFFVSKEIGLDKAKPQKVEVTFGYHAKNSDSVIYVYQVFMQKKAGDNMWAQLETVKKEFADAKTLIPVGYSKLTVADVEAAMHRE